MKLFSKSLLSVVIALCFLAVPFYGVSAQAASVSLMPSTEDGYTIVAGDGNVTITDGVMTIVNNSDGDLRVTLDNTTAFDLTALHTLQMSFNAEMSFKMAYHLVSADSTSAWLNTSDNFVDMYTITSDRAAAGSYDVKMNLHDPITTITDKSSVHFNQFIILLTGKGTFTLTKVAMTDGSDGGETTSTTAGDTTSTDAENETTAAATTTTVKKTTAKQEGGAKTADISEATLFVAVAAVAVGTVTLTAVSKKCKSR